MTELDFLLATDVARLMAASAILREVMASDRVPAADHQAVLRMLFDWQEATFKAIQVRRDETEAAAAPKETP